MMTRLAPPARWAAAAWRLVKRPVDSMTTSAPTSAHWQLGRVAFGEDLDHLAVDDEVAPLHLDGAREASVGRVVPQQVGVDLRREQVVHRHDLDVGGVVSRTARRKLRPIRPNPLIPTRTVISHHPSFSARHAWRWRSTDQASPGRFANRRFGHSPREANGRRRW